MIEMLVQSDLFFTVIEASHKLYVEKSYIQ